MKTRGRALVTQSVNNQYKKVEMIRTACKCTRNATSVQVGAPLRHACPVGTKMDFKVHINNYSRRRNSIEA